MQGQLEASRAAAEKLPPRVDVLLERVDAMRDELKVIRSAADALPDRLDALRDDLSGVLREIATVRETIEPLQGPAERLARVDERLPAGA
jgi:hypothetical protein